MGHIANTVENTRILKNTQLIKRTSKACHSAGLGFDVFIVKHIVSNSRDFK